MLEIIIIIINILGLKKKKEVAEGHRPSRAAASAAHPAWLPTHSKAKHVTTT